MAFVVKYNSMLGRSMRQLSRLSRERADTMEQVSSARRIPQAKHDAAGSAVASNLDATQRSKRQAVRNINDGLSMLSVAEGGLNAITANVQRMRELAVQSASETLDDTERTYLQNEYSELMSEVSRVALETTWGDKFLLTFQRVDVGLIIDTSGSMGGEINSVKTALTDFKNAFHDGGLDVGLALIENHGGKDNKDSTIRRSDIDDGTFLTELNKMKSKGASVDPWAAMMNSSGVQDDPGVVEPDAITWSVNGKAKVLVSITDTYREVDLLAGTETQQSVADDLAAAGVTVHSINPKGQNGHYSTITSTTGGGIHDIGDVSGSGIGAAMTKVADSVSDMLGTGAIAVQVSHGDTEASRIDINLPVNATAGGMDLDLTTVATSGDAVMALDTLDSALDALNGYRARVGSYTNRLESALALETNAVEHTMAAQHRIEDLDMAFATAELVRQQVLQKASMAVMGQAKGMSESVLSLIR